MATLVAPIPSSGLSRKITPRNLGMEFGDGYSESIPDGINTMLMELAPSWKLLSFEQADAMDLFFRTQHGQTFLWKMPRETGFRRWKCPEWELVEGQTTAEINATFKEQPPL